MRNPELVEVLRGALVESRHRGAVAVIDADGASVLAPGDVAAPVYPRSAVPPLAGHVNIHEVRRRVRGPIPGIGVIAVSRGRP